ncbi:zinc finger DHHC-type palmitoyltransferase 4 [Phyllostomus discolor]|uniref:Zinc finger DHHC-type palmitoyltransferase 4 n=1 Tax=Phyllostomus discolor TaxID=89673 RepID=A0A833YVJ7_9CHIR|nr:zinc finger DHHC-type palmitoyltransferase 4 [Phyllostomus discolor]
MDFLVLFLFYLAAVLVGGAMICVCSRTSYLRGLVRGGTQVFSYIIPECLQRAMLSLVHYLFHTRNYVFVVLHLTLQGMVYTEYTWEVFGYCRDLGFSLCYLLLPYLLLVVNLAFFTLSSVTDPGAITKANELLLLQVYEFDEVMFPKDARCPTCDLRKPARSKHCDTKFSSELWGLRLVVMKLPLEEQAHSPELSRTALAVLHERSQHQRVVFCNIHICVDTAVYQGN